MLNRQRWVGYRIYRRGEKYSDSYTFHPENAHNKISATDNSVRLVSLTLSVQRTRLFLKSD